MRTSRTSRLAALVAAACALAPALAQDRPESLLPPGFGQPAPAPSRAPLPPPSIGGAPAPLRTPDPATAVVQPLPSPSVTPSPTPSATPTPDPVEAALYEMPLAARRSLRLVGPTGANDGGVSAQAFGGADGRFVERLMRRTDAPGPSRWMHILLRRTLASRLATPRGVNGADFAAERAWLLLRMGEAAAARAVVQGVDTANTTPKLLQVAMNAMLATGDPGGLCPLADRGVSKSGEAGWTLAQAMCAGLSGDGAGAARQIAAARRRRIASGIDLALARKVVGAGSNRSAVSIEWSGTVQLTAWRWGLATAMGVEVPAPLYDTVGRQVRYWAALSPAIPATARVAAAEAAAGQGVLSNAALVDLYGAVLDDPDAQGQDTSVAQDLRTAYTERTFDARIAAMRAVWGGDARPPYARLVLTARAAARLPATPGRAEADAIVASLLSAGLDRTAARWRGAVPEGSDAWAMIALSDPDRNARITARDIASLGDDGSAKRRLFFAGAAGLGLMTPDEVERAAQALEVRIGADTAWTRALDRATAAGEQGTVVVLAALGMQTPGWRGVPPETLYRILDALRAVGLAGEARMIAAEAIART